MMKRMETAKRKKNIITSLQMHCNTIQSRERVRAAKTAHKHCASVHIAAFVRHINAVRVLSYVRSVYIVMNTYTFLRFRLPPLFRFGIHLSGQFFAKSNNLIKFPSSSWTDLQELEANINSFRIRIAMLCIDTHGEKNNRATKSYEMK